MGIFIIMCILAKKNYNELEKTNKSNEEAKKQAEVLIDEINNTVVVLNESNEKNKRKYHYNW